MSFDTITSRSFSAQGKANYDRIFRPHCRQSETCEPEPSPDTGGGPMKSTTDVELREQAAQELADAIDRGLVPTC